MHTICCWRILMVDCCPGLSASQSQVFRGRAKKRLLPMVDPRNLVILGDYNINLSIQSHAWNFCGRGASWTLLNLDNSSYVYESWWNFGKNLHPGLCCWIFSFSYNANMNYQATQVISIEIKTISYRYSYTTTAS